LAADLQLPVAAKRESMGICFVGRRRSGLAAFLRPYLPAADGPVTFVDVETGAAVGRTARPAHAALYVPGQGARIGGASQKYFCVDSDRKRNVVHVCGGTHHPALYADSLTVIRINWIAGSPPPPLERTGSMRVRCRVRHLQPLIDCTLLLLVPRADGGGGVALSVRFDRPVRGIAPGQWAVFYCGPVCLGGGPIERRGPSYWERDEALPAELHPAGHNDLSVLNRETTDEKASATTG
jgi:tRNA-specific 2-thiouridylase